MFGGRISGVEDAFGAGINGMPSASIAPTAATGGSPVRWTLWPVGRREKGEPRQRVLRFEPFEAPDVVGTDSENHLRVPAKVLRDAVGFAVCRSEDELRELGSALFRGRVDFGLQLDEVTLDEVAGTGSPVDERLPLAFVRLAAA